MTNNKWEKIYQDEEPHTPSDYGTFSQLREDDECVRCPCCDTQFNTLYRRPIYKAMGAALIALSKFLDKKEIHSSSVGDFTKLKHWGLVEQYDDGYWVLTNRGREFLRGQTHVPKYVYLRNNIPVGFSEETIYFHDVMK